MRCMSIASVSNIWKFCDSDRSQMSDFAYVLIDLDLILSRPLTAANQRREFMKIILCDWL